MFMGKASSICTSLTHAIREGLYNWRKKLCNTMPSFFFSESQFFSSIQKVPQASCNIYVNWILYYSSLNCVFIGGFLFYSSFPHSGQNLVITKHSWLINDNLNFLTKMKDPWSKRQSKINKGVNIQWMIKLGLLFRSYRGEIVSKKFLICVVLKGYLPFIATNGKVCVIGHICNPWDLLWIFALN